MQNFDVIRVDAAGLRAELAEYESAYGMKSEEFLRRWNHGEPGFDTHAYSAWAGLCQMALRQGVLDVRAVSAVTA
jgi:hypothetical protein